MTTELTLGQKQRIFCSNIGKLIAFAYTKGYELSFGDASRSDEQAEINALGTAGRAQLIELLRTVPLFHRLAECIRNNAGSGIRTSLHELRLAVDFNLYLNGAYIADGSKYKELGEYWESLHPLNRWGGRFNDGNHFSMEHNGRK